MIYLDNAATTRRKPSRVYRAVQAALRNGANAGRGDYPAAEQTAQLLYDCRSALAGLFHVPSVEQVVFTFNATIALNMAIKGLAQPGAQVLVSPWEHNAVIRPLTALASQGVRFRAVQAPLFAPDALLDAFERELNDGADLVVCTHVSNVFGMILPIERIDALCAARGVPLIIDASQSAGCVPLDFSALRAARFVCMPGHKGLYGPQGTGVMLCRDAQAKTLLEGGTGSDSARQEQPAFLPDRFECGTQNAAGIAGLYQGVRYVREKTPEKILQYERSLIWRAADGLPRIPGVTCFRGSMEEQAGVLSFVAAQSDPHALARSLASAGICVRAGLHCAALAHTSAGTLHTGTVRLSVSAFSTPSEIDALVCAVRTALSRASFPCASSKMFKSPEFSQEII